MPKNSIWVGLFLLPPIIEKIPILDAIAKDGNNLRWPGTEFRLDRESISLSGDWGIAYLDYYSLLIIPLVGEQPSLVILHQIGLSWYAVLPLYCNAVQYNDWLDSLPNDIISVREQEGRLAVAAEHPHLRWCNALTENLAAM